MTGCGCFDINKQSHNYGFYKAQIKQRTPAVIVERKPDMKKTLFSTLLLTFIACCSVTIHAATMAIDSLSGAVTTNEIASFKAYMQTQTPPQTPWGALNGTNGSHNLWADGDDGRDLEAMGEMYEVSGDIAILTNMIGWADICVSQRNDLMSSANGGQRVMWTGLKDKVWCPNEPTDPNAKYAGSENEDVEGHIAYCAKLILENPSIWNTTVPDGNPFGYGVTYFQRATNYLAKCDEANDEYSLKWFIQAGSNLIIPPTNSAWIALDENVTANNRQMMFTSGFQRLAEAHELLGDNPSRVAQYDAIVVATVDQDLTGMINFDPYTKSGHSVYDWGYYPTNNAPESVEIHGEYDMIGVWRAYNRAAYGYTLSPLIPFANTMVYVIYLGTNTFAGNVDASGGTQSPIYSGWLLTADWNPQAYITVAGASYTNGWYKNKTDVDAGILFMKNRRYLEFSVSASPASQSVNAGSGTSYTTSLSPLGGFNGTVNLTISGLPSGATGNFNHSAINLATIDAPSTNLTLTVTTSTSTPGGTYMLNVIGTSGSVSHTDTVSLVVSDFTISATPSSQTVTAGGSTNYTVNTGNINAFTGNISLSASGLPSGATVNFSPASINAPGSSTMTVTTTNTMPASTNTLTVKGTSGSLSHSSTVTLIVTPSTSTAGVNLALNKTAIASSTWSTNYTAAMAVDGSDSTRWSAASGQTNNQWVLIDLGAGTSYNRVLLKEISFPRVTSFKIQSSNDATNFTDLVTGTTIGASNTVMFAQVASRYVRLYIPTSAGVPTINEIQVYQDAQLFQNTSYGGWFANFPLGTYTMAQLIAAGGVNDDASSVRVPPGMKVTLYTGDNFTGTNVVETADDPSLIDNGINDATSSLKVEAN